MRPTSGRERGERASGAVPFPEGICGIAKMFCSEMTQLSRQLFPGLSSRSPGPNSADRACRQGGGAPLEEIAASFARFFGSIDLEKLDIVVGFVLVEVLQARRLTQQGGCGILCLQCMCDAYQLVWFGCPCEDVTVKLPGPAFNHLVAAGAAAEGSHC